MKLILVIGIAIQASAALFAAAPDILVTETGKNRRLDSAPSSELGSLPQARIKATGRDLDLAIQGDGFFKLILPSGEFAYTRYGEFRTGPLGKIESRQGYPLDGGFVLSKECCSIDITRDGRVTIALPDGTEQLEIHLDRFSNPAGLEHIENDLYRPTAKSGKPLSGPPNSPGFGAIVQRALEFQGKKTASEEPRTLPPDLSRKLNRSAIIERPEAMKITYSQTVKQP